MLLENIGENFEGPSWSNRIFFYFCLFSSLLIIFLLVFISFTAINPDFAIPNGPHYNTTELRNMGFFDNERYLISALVQSLAATIALVITLSLVAVQLAAQSYSARVIDVYKNNPDMWILLSIYIVVIFYGLGLLKVIDIGVAGINMEFAIFAAYSLGFFAFVCLVPYIVKTLDLLKPSTVITLLAEEVTKEKLLKRWEKEWDEIAENDPLQPIMEIIITSLERNDNETAKNGLVSIVSSTIPYIESSELSILEKQRIAIFTVEYIIEVGKYAIRKENWEIARVTLRKLNDFGIKTIEYGFILDDLVRELNTQSSDLSDSYPYFRGGIVHILGQFVMRYIEQINFGKIDDKTTLETMIKVGEASGKEGYDSDTHRYIEELLSIYLKSTKNHEDIAKIVIAAARRIEATALNNKLKKASQKGANVLGDMALKELEKSKQEETFQIIDFLAEMEKRTDDEILENTKYEIIESIVKVGLKAKQSDFQDVRLKCIAQLNNIGNRAADINFKKKINDWIKKLN
ncbi:MAG: hypothetical protein A4E23_00047 [Methanomethylovorans sp. PtaU1.Bin073]|nr:MAG: hypothetical protein A4E23_00047 [Methanomethylovorans sp. PtaU1.Bin073]